MKLGLAGRRALVGASSEGLGLETARALAEEGADVVLCGRSKEKLDAAMSSLASSVAATDAQGRQFGVVADLGTPDGARRLALAATEKLGGIDVLVANVGGPPPGLAQNVELDPMRAAIEQNLLSMIELCQQVLPGMRAQGWGRILAITSGSVRVPLPAMVYSNTTRAGLTGYLKTLAREVTGDGVTVNSILPSNQLTARLEAIIGDNVDAYAAGLPSGRGGDPRDFGRIAAFLCSEPANYLTGVALSVDGGVDPFLV